MQKLKSKIGANFPMIKNIYLLEKFSREFVTPSAMMDATRLPECAIAPPLAGDIVNTSSFSPISLADA